jgi:tetraacyldisaccharide 4'-kinase
LLLDDGFQHRRLARDLDVVLLDATEPFGFDRLLPRGTLREPIGGLRRAAVVVLSRADMLQSAERDAIRRRVATLNPRAVWCEVEHRPALLLAADGTSQPLGDAAGKSVAAFCGIGNPAGFRHTVASLGCHAATWREFPDHHSYERTDVDALAAWVQAAHVDLVLCTRKDLVKIRAPSLGGVPLRAVAVELNFLHGQDEFAAALAPLAEQALSGQALSESPTAPGSAQE